MKKKRMQKLLSLLLAVVMVLSIMPVKVYAAEELLQPDVEKGIFYRDEGTDVLDLGTNAGHSQNQNIIASYAWQYDEDLYVALKVKSAGWDNHYGDLVINGVLIPKEAYMQVPLGKALQIRDESKPNITDSIHSYDIPGNSFWRVVKVEKQGNLITLKYDTHGTDNGWNIDEIVYVIQGTLTVHHHYAGIELPEMDMYQSKNPIGGLPAGEYSIRSQKEPDAEDQRDSFYKDGYQLSSVTVKRGEQDPVEYAINDLRSDSNNGNVYWLDVVTTEAEKGDSIEIDFYYDAVYHIAHVQNGENKYTEDFLWTYGDYKGRNTVNLTEHVTGTFGATEEERKTDHFFTGDDGKKQIGFLYGGMYAEPDEDGSFDTLLTVEDEIDARYITPKAGKTYYIKEVPETYLLPKLISLQKNGQVAGAYMLTAIDNHNDYLRAGFDITMNGVAEQKAVEKLEAYTLIDALLFKGAQHRYYKVGVNSDNQGHTGASPIFTDLYFDKNAVTVGDFVCSTFTEGDEDSVKFVQDRKNDGKAVTFIPYFVTRDGLKVTGISKRTFKFENGQRNATPVATEYVKSGITRSESVPASPMVLRSAFMMAFDEETTVDEFTITKICGNLIEEQVITAGDWTGKVSYADAEGQMFAGWYADAELTVPADFSDVQSDMTVYAKYISDDYLTVYVEQGKNELTLYAAVNADIYSEYGFVYNEESVALSGVKKVYGNTAQKLFGVNGVLICDTFQPKNLAEGVSVVIPYAVTADGTIVYGAALEMEEK